jgi:hypothetical protein
MESGSRSRAERGARIAACGGVRRTSGDSWRVDSQTKAGRGYTVLLNQGGATCTCPDYETEGPRWCKHVHAVLVTLAAEAVAAAKAGLAGTSVGHPTGMARAPEASRGTPTESAGTSAARSAAKSEMSVEQVAVGTPAGAPAGHSRRSGGNASSDATSAARGTQNRNQAVMGLPSQGEADQQAAATLERMSRPTYARDWAAYNAAQTCEKRLFEEFVAELVQAIDEPPHTQGRPPLRLSDIVATALLRIYSMQSGRRFTSDAISACERGLIVKTPHYNSVYRYLGKECLTDILKRLLERSAAPARVTEWQFAVDSTGFSTWTYRRWLDHRTARQGAGWIKAHCMAGTVTHVVVAAEVMPGGQLGSGDAPHLVPLTAAAVRQGFDVREVSADGAYLSHDNVNGVAALGGKAFIPFRDVSTPNSGSSVWRAAYALCVLEPERFREHYHRRSNVETVFSAIKRVFGAYLRTQQPVPQINEVYLKLIAHNIRCLVRAIFELGLEPRLRGQEVS